MSTRINVSSQEGLRPVLDIQRTPTSLAKLSHLTEELSPIVPWMTKVTELEVNQDEIVASSQDVCE